MMGLRPLNMIHGMFGLIARIKQARAERLRRRKLMADQSECIAKSFREVRTAAELARQAARGMGPHGVVVSIGDGFFVERTEDGRERTVLIDKFQELPPLPTREELGAQAAKLNEYRAKLDEFREKAEKAGLTRNHPSVAALAGIPRLGIPPLALPKLEIPPLEPPEPPKFDFMAPPKL